MQPDSATIDRPFPADIPADASDELAGTSIEFTDRQSVAVLCAPAGSRAVIAGLGDPSVARALSARMCRVWGIVTDPDAAAAALPWCEQIVDDDLQTLNPEGLLAGERAEAILILNGLEQRPDAGNILSRMMTLLAPGGRIVLAVPNDGEPSTGLVDRVRAHELFRQVGLAAIDEIPLADPLEDGGAAAGMQHLLIAAPDAAAAGDMQPALAGAVMAQLHRLQRRHRQLDAAARDLERQLARQSAANVELHAALEEAREWHRRSAASVTAGADSLRREAREREQLQQELVATAEALEECRVERRFLRDDLAVKDAYLASLREENARYVALERQRELAQREQQLDWQQREQAHEVLRAQRDQEHEAERRQWDERVRALAYTLETTESRQDAAANRAVQLEAANAELHEHRASLQEELHRVHVAIAETLAQPRYVLADRVNGWARRLRVVHRPLKRLWLGRQC